MAIFKRTGDPVESAVTPDEFWRHLNLSEDTDRDLAQEKLDEAIAHLDGYAGILGNAIIDQTWQALFARGCDRTGDGRQGFDFSFGPVIAVTKLEAYVSGGWVEVDASNYTVREIQGGWRLRRTSSGVWPSPDNDENAWRVTFRAGWSEAAAVPLSICAAIKILATHLFENRGEADAPIPTAVYNLIAPWRSQAI